MYSDDPTNKQELAKFMDATIKDKAKRDKLKRVVYDDVVAKGFPKKRLTNGMNHK